MACRGICTLLPKSYHPQLDRQIAIIEEKEKQREKRRQKWHLEEEEKRESAEKVLQDYLYGSPVFTSQELLEIVHPLEEQIEELPDAFLKKVLHEMGDEKYHCFYVFNDKIRQRILRLDDDFIQDYRGKLTWYTDYTEAQKLEEEEIIGAVLVMSGIIKRLRKQER